MEEVSNQIVQFINDNGSLSNLVGNRVYPIFAKEDVEGLFVVYVITRQDGESKDADSFSVDLKLYSTNDHYKDLVRASDVFTDEIKKQYNWVSSHIGMDPQDQSLLSIIKLIIN